MIIVLIILFLFFIIWTYLMLNDKFFNLDNSFYDKLIIKEPYTTFFKIITNLANTKLFILICCISLLFLNDKKLGLVITILMLIDAILVFLIKFLIKRKRPDKNPLVKERGYSYPSGHMVSAISFYGFILFLVLISNIILPFKIIISISIIIIILFIGLSRIFLGVHYLSDIIGAIFIGTNYILLYIYLLQNIKI